MLKKILNPLYVLTIFVRWALFLRMNGLNVVVNFLRKYGMLFYVFLIAINIAILSYYLVNVLPMSLPNYSYFDGVVLYFNDHKKVELAEYIVGVVFLGLWFLTAVFGTQKLSKRARRYINVSIQSLLEKDNFIILNIALFVNLFLPVLLIYIGHYNLTTILIQFGSLLIGIIIPLWSYLLRFGHTGVFRKSKLVEIKKSYDEVIRIDESVNSRILWSILVVFTVSFLGYIFYNPIFQNPKIINEYFNIPEQTIIKTKHAYKVVDNTAYWSKHMVSPITFKSDVNGKLYKDNCLNGTLNELNILMPSLMDSNVYYNKFFNQLCFNGDIPVSDFDIHNTSLFNVLNKNHELASQRSFTVVTAEDQSFIQSNMYELRWQLASRFMIHHNGFMFIPISSLMLHESSAHVSAQYGLSNAKLFAFVYNKFGDISFDNWLRVSYVFYLVYFLMLILVSASITRSYVWTAIILIMSLTIENLHGYDFLLLPPGDSPWRNLLDLLSLLMMFIYSRQKSFIFYVIALFLGLVSIILNPQIGLMILVATLLSGVFYAVYERLRIKLTLISSILTLVGALYLYVKSTGDDDLAQYYLDGVIGFSINFIQLIQLFVAILISYLIIFKIIRKQTTKNYIYLIFMVIYAQELLLYVVWHFNTDGFLARGYIYTLAIILLVFNIKSFIPDNIKKILCIGILGLYCYSVIFMLQSKYQYDKIFEQHVTYNWNLDRAHITSTMNPIYFENGVKLIEKYSKNQNGIYIISEYDNFLPFLSHKYSLMPFFDMKWYMVTPKELNKTINLLKIQQPEYLFVDTNIDRNLNNEIIDSNLTKIGVLNQESIWRVQRLKLLSLVYQSVAANYTLVESSSLISVYKLKNKIR